MEIRRIREPELPAAMDLCWRVFLEFEAPGLPAGGRGSVLHLYFKY